MFVKGTQIERVYRIRDGFFMREPAYRQAGAEPGKRVADCFRFKLIFLRMGKDTRKRDADFLWDVFERNAEPGKRVADFG